MSEAKRICACCKKEVGNAGYTDHEGSLYLHEECLVKYLNKTYQPLHWMITNDDGAGGYFMASDDDHNFGTGIFYTEWEDDDD